MQFASDMITFARELFEYQMNNAEIALYVSIVLMDPERIGLNFPEQIQEIRRTLVQGLQAELRYVRERSDSPMLESLSLRLSDLKSLNIAYMTHLRWVKEHKERMELPPLFSELFDLGLATAPPTPAAPDDETPRPSPEDGEDGDVQEADVVPNHIENNIEGAHQDPEVQPVAPANVQVAGPSNQNNNGRSLQEASRQGNAQQSPQ